LGDLGDLGDVGWLGKVGEISLLLLELFSSNLSFFPPPTRDFFASDLSSAKEARIFYGENICHLEIVLSASAHVITCHVMSCHVMSCHVMSCHVMSCHVMSCHALYLRR
jgi:hypothetical protein